jgi:ABC-type polysaccharide/polyol phosphate export permease
MSIIKDLYNYRELLKTNVKKDVRGKYKKSFFGILWSFLNPLLQIAVYSFVFGKILNAGEDNYSIFICCGLIPWLFFSTAINRSTTIMVENGGIIKKVFFPREILPISLVTSETVNFIISTVIILAFVLIGGMGISWTWLFYPFILLVLYLFLIGASFILSSITVYFRDLQHFTGVFMQLLFYATPIAYSATRVPESFQWVVKINPVAYIIEGCRDIFIYHEMPNVGALAIVGVLSLLFITIGYIIFDRLQRNFAEEL